MNACYIYYYFKNVKSMNVLYIVIFQMLNQILYMHIVISGDETILNNSFNKKIIFKMTTIISLCTCSTKQIDCKILYTI
jgi:hypothetical protein